MRLFANLYRQERQKGLTLLERRHYEADGLKKSNQAADPEEKNAGTKVAANAPEAQHRARNAEHSITALKIRVEMVKEPNQAGRGIHKT